MAAGRVTLLSAPGAALYAGGLWWVSLLAAAEYEGLALLDCGAAPGRALEALKLGVSGLVLQAPAAAFAVVAELAAAQNAVLLAKPPPALDLALPGSLRRLAAWVAG